MEFLPEEAFYRTAHQMIYRSMVGLSELNQPVDQITLTACHHKTCRLLQLAS